MVSISTSVDELFFKCIINNISKYVNQIENRKSEEKREHLNQTGQNFSGPILFDEIVMSIK